MLSTERAPRTHPFSRFRTVPHYTPTPRTVPMTTQPEIEHIWVITGPAGCGKTTVASYLSQELGYPYLEGDDFHPPSNKQKMGSGIPLTDADRWDWLITLRNAATAKLTQSNAVIVTCSALKHKYRDVIRVASYEHPSVQVHFIFLKVDEETLQARVKARVGHYMKESMVHSQMEALEEPQEDEFDVLKIDVTQDKDAVRNNALAGLRAKLKEYEPPTTNGHT
ncbi:putative gluconokinase [Cyphellophora attinorum]|uniref:Gluconokinase n=1 Tax=Cyphellophora attinorum TaxID=1664694 RepID=A0A0N1NYH5_9EURO|nr:putative gluconokinase [Phialophora attinorum]KPI36730.1 putative gluconokinase [Phialophora attinorum]